MFLKTIEVIGDMYVNLHENLPEGCHIDKYK